MRKKTVNKQLESDSSSPRTGKDLKAIRDDLLKKTDPVAYWLENIPKIPQGKLKQRVDLEMDVTLWMHLVEGCAAHGWTIERAIYHLVVDRRENLIEWANDHYRIKPEQE
jgi:hypothetical protein